MDSRPGAGPVKTGRADLPLHGGHCPSWLFEDMKELGAGVVEALLVEFSREEVLRRFSDPGWFQAFGCLLGFDWHSSGLTTVVLGALKEALNPRAHELGLFVAGGKGAASRQTPRELADYADARAPDLPVDDLQHTSRMAAKVDSAAVQDGHQLYHHCMIVTPEGNWCVVQQGMRGEAEWARRYHWLDEAAREFLDDPHAGIRAVQEETVLNLATSGSRPNRSVSLDLVREDPVGLLKDYHRLRAGDGRSSRSLELPRRHELPEASSLDRVLGALYERPPEDYEDLLGRDGVGPKTVRALSMVAEVVWGASPSYEDPARYAFAHGGKDGHPFPVQKQRYRQSIDALREAVRSARVGRGRKMKALERLAELTEKGPPSKFLPDSGPVSADPGDENPDPDDQLSLEV